MIQDNLLLVLCLLFVISILTMLSSKLKIAYPIFLVIGGLLISLIPGIPRIALQPDLVFLIFLPPLLYAAAWNTSWNDFWKYRRPISLLGFGLVIFTSAAVAWISKALIPDFSLACGFLLGGIISPPDAVAATSVLAGLKVPKQITTILEGESLVNDAASLIVFRFALAAVVTGQFNIWDATQTFFVVAIAGILIGLAIANIAYVIHRYFPTTPAIDAAFTLITPYIMYFTAEHFHVSGVLAVVAGGLFLTYRSQDIFSYDARIQVLGLWDTLVFLLNGVVFIMIGLQLPGIIKGMENYSVGQAISYAIVISLATIVIRIAWMFPGAYLPRILFKRIREKETKPTWQGVLLTGWSGMRGVVSLASALAVPLTLANDKAFPHRNLILFITFVVILFTLVLQGLSLKPMIRWLKIRGDEKDAENMQALDMRLRLANAVLAYIDDRYANEIETNDTYKRVRDRYARMIEITQKKLDTREMTEEEKNFLPHYRQMLLELVQIRRRELNHFRHTNTFSEELIREREYELDLEEARLRG
ncbi:Na+/H+ antiporter [Niastella koreensis]|uniref:Sodium/proton antiporter, CPA1 family n=3 Tax=Niastella koreensis TaxID=354356 RepID=G8TM53_NIAKG|nr:Na+/H+ antiporter [Niastella koreensis]AEV99826.1 sodium/proton antiporter, CPA1 family [Niastella koreensis GR20-10]OQP51555.1 Na+/H+ antiporter [Niastella koreensis]